MKLTSLMFGLLLAVGWTNVAQAQALPQGGFAERLGIADVGAQVNTNVLASAQKKATAFDQSITNMVMGQASVKGPVQAKALPLPKRTMASAPKRVADTGPNSVVHNKAYYQQFKYSYTDDNGTVHNDVDPTEEAKDPNQIYELLRWVYGNPNFPGPKYSAYTPAYVQEDPVVYGPIAGGWNITAAGSGTNDQVITITTSDTYAFMDSIYVKAGDQLLTAYGGVAGDWNSSTYAAVFPTGWTASPTATYYVYSGQVYSFFYQNGGGTITIPKSLLQGNSTVQVYIEGLAASTSYASTITVNGETQSLSSEERTTLTWTVTFPEEDPDTFVQGTVQAPYEDGYTALMVSLYNDTTKIYPENMNSYQGSWQYTQKSDLINYIRDNIQSVKLLTDGMRIGSRDDHTIGTVFSCDGTYNRFFLLGKGQARKKAPQLQTNINNGYWPEYCGEEGPFKTMFEQFSPTTGNVGADITDFYSKLMEGNVYNVVHDCASVIQNKHQFSMSGKKGTQAIALTGLNFFIPDYRLLWWSLNRSVNGYSATVDGRDMNPYVATNTTSGAHGTTNYYSSATSIPYFAAWFAQYNQQFAPKMGIYKIMLDATANQVAQLYAPGNRNYAVTLTWVSSLNEMSGHEVPQTYTVYYFDENGDRQYLVVEGVTNTNGQTGVTTLTYYVEQKEHSYTIDYIVEGSPDDTEHPQFVAISNVDGVVIPGWNDFVGLELDHHESDFVVKDMANWYRNFLSVVNEDLYNGLTVSAVTGANGKTPMNKFSLYRYNYKGTQASSTETKVAEIELFDATPSQVSYRVKYDDDASDSTLVDQQVLAAKYERQAMGIADEGVIRVKGNGDLVIWPNNYYVNFRTITIKNGTQPVDSWNAASMSTLPSGWKTSPGSKWEEFTHNGVKVGYMEGGGYIYIPNMLNQYSNLSVEIEAFGEGGNVKRIAVNDETQDITATAAGTTYTWTSLSPNALHAPKMAATNVTLNFSGQGYSNKTDMTTNPLTVSGITASFAQGTNSNKPTYYTNGAAVRVYGGNTFTVSSAHDNITAIKLNFGSDDGSNTITSNVGSWSSPDWTGNAKSVTFTVGGTSGNRRIASINVTTEGAGEETTTVDLTVCDGNYFSEQLPVYGYFYDCAQHNQLVYPASMLTAMAGKKIKSMTFYPTTGYVDDNNNGSYDSGETTYSGLNFYGGSVTFKLANLSSGTAAFADEDATLITGTMTPVKTLTPSRNTSATTWVIEFDQEFTYNGGDLLIDITSTAGTDNHTAFFGNVVDANHGAFTFTYNNTSYAVGSVFLPKVTFDYETEGGEAPAVEGGLLRMHMLLVDQLKQEIPVDNSHPDAYGYVLRFEPNGPEGDGKKQSGHVKVNIEKTDAQPNGYYTVAQINNDKNIDTTLLTMDILDAQVKMNLNDENPNVLYFQMQGAAKNSIPDTYLSQLQYMKNVRKYEEMLEGSAHKGEQYDADKVHYYFNDATPELGSYADGDFKAYAPSVSTWGIDRRYFEVDGENNTYGAPVWKTAVGKAQMGLNPDDPNDPNYKPTVLFQEGWNTSWTVDGKGSNLYMLDNINAIGYLPKKEVTNVEYEPYMFRVFVESDNGKLRPFKYVTVTDDEGKSHSVITADEKGSTTGPTCVWSGYMLNANGEIIKSDPDNGVVIDFASADGPFYYTKNRVMRTPTPEPTEDNPNPERPAWDKDEENAIFGALDDLLEITGYDAQGKPIYKDIPEEDLRIFVRFYYMVKGWNANSMSLRAGEGEGEGDEARPGNGAQSPGSAAGSVATAVNEIQYLGEIVSQTYYNVQGMVSDKPFDGVNIVVTRFGNGTTSVSKIVR